MSQPAAEDVTFRHKMYRAETRTDPSDGKPYTLSVIRHWYLGKGWTEEEIERYWHAMQPHSFGRTRTKKKTVLPDGHPLVKKRKQEAAAGSKWESR